MPQDHDVSASHVSLRLPGDGKGLKANEAILDTLVRFARTAGEPIRRSPGDGAIELRDITTYLHGLALSAAPVPDGWVEVEAPGKRIWSMVAQRCESLAVEEDAVDLFSLLALGAALEDWTQMRMDYIVDPSGPVPGPASAVAQRLGLSKTLAALNRWLARGLDLHPLAEGPFSHHLSHVVLENTSLVQGERAARVLDYLSLVASIGAAAIAENPHFTETGYQSMIEGISGKLETGNWPHDNLYRFGLPRLFRFADKRGWSLRPETVAALKRQMPSLATAPIKPERLVVPELARDEACYQVMAFSPALQPPEHYGAAMMFHSGVKWVTLAKRGLQASALRGWDAKNLGMYVEALEEGVGRIAAEDISREEAIPFMAAGHPAIRAVGRAMVARAARVPAGRKL